MFIPTISKENIIDEESIGLLYDDSFNGCVDILDRKRVIILHSDVDLKRSAIEGIHSVKCTLINLSVLDGRYNYDTNFNPGIVLCKTVYNGEIQIPITTDLTDGVVTDSSIYDSYFRILNAYTSYIGLWDNNGSMTSAPMGVSILNMMDMKLSTSHFRKSVTMNTMEMAAKLEVSFDGDTFQTILPIPKPQFYSRMHAEANREDPIITHSGRIPGKHLFDSVTTRHKLVHNRITDRGDLDYEYDNNVNSELTYLDNDNNVMSTMKDFMPLHIKFSLMTSLINELFSRLFRICQRYQINSVDFIFDSDTNRLVLPSVKFYYNPAPTDIIVDFISYVIEDFGVSNALADIVMMCDNCRVIGRLTDLKYDLTILLGDNSKKRIETGVRGIKYQSSTYDTINSMTSFETNVSSPINNF